MKMTCDNDCTINGWIEYEAESFGHDDLHISVNPSSNLDDVVVAFCHDTQDTFDEAHDWIHQEVARRVDYAVQHSPYTMSETDIQDLEANEYALVSLTDGVVTEFMCV